MHTVRPDSVTAAAATVRITEYSLGSTPSNGALTAGTDGSLWTQSQGTRAVDFVRLYNAHAAAFPVRPQYPPYLADAFLATSGTKIFGIATNPGRDVEQDYASLFEMPQSGGPATNPSALCCTATGMTATVNGMIWSITSDRTSDGGGFAYITAAATGATHSVSLPFNYTGTNQYDSVPTGAVTQGPDGNVWVGTYKNNNTTSTPPNFVVYSTTGTLVKTIQLTHPATGAVAGPDGAMWFTSSTLIGRITVSGAATYYRIPSGASTSGFITQGRDGAVWFTEEAANKIGRISMQGQITEYAVPTANAKPLGIVRDPGACGSNTIWFAEAGSGKIASLDYL